MIRENELMIERASILEFDAGFDRGVAYRKAFDAMNDEWVAIIAYDEKIQVYPSVEELKKYAADNDISDNTEIKVMKKFVGLQKKP